MNAIEITSAIRPLATVANGIRGFERPAIDGFPENSVHIPLPLYCVENVKIKGKQQQALKCVWVHINKDTQVVTTSLRGARQIVQPVVKTFAGKRNPEPEDRVQQFGEKYNGRVSILNAVGDVFKNYAFDEVSREEIAVPDFIAISAEETRPFYFRKISDSSNETRETMSDDNLSHPLVQTRKVAMYQTVPQTAYIKPDDLKKIYDENREVFKTKNIATVAEMDKWLAASL